jgi:hypothetical protein
MWRKAERRRSPAGLSVQAAWQRGSTRGSPECRPAHDFTERSYLFTGDVNRNGGGVNLVAEESPAVRIQRWQSDPYRTTVPWDMFISVPDSQI